MLRQSDLFGILAFVVLTGYFVLVEAKWMLLGLGAALALTCLYATRREKKRDAARRKSYERFMDERLSLRRKP